MAHMGIAIILSAWTAVDRLRSSQWLLEGKRPAGPGSTCARNVTSERGFGGLGRYCLKTSVVVARSFGHPGGRA